MGQSCCGKKGAHAEGYQYEKFHQEPRSHSSPLQKCCTCLCRSLLVCCCCGVMIPAAILAVCASRPIESQITAEWIDENLGGDRFFTSEDLPVQRSASLLSNLSAGLADATELNAGSNVTFRYGQASQVVSTMYQATKVDGVWENIPEKFRGVFWMKGNGAAEELTVFQYGFYKNGTMLVPISPFMWAWPLGVPKEAPMGGAVYNASKEAAMILIQNGSGVTYSYGFSPCPSGQACEAGSTNFSYSVIQGHEYGDLSKYSVNMKHLLSLPFEKAAHIQGYFDMQEIADQQVPGALWKRPCFWGIGSCSCLEFGTYDLTKILDGDGNKVEPYYSEFLQYMGDVPLFVWTGHNGTAAEAAS